MRKKRQEQFCKRAMQDQVPSTVLPPNSPMLIQRISDKALSYSSYLLSPVKLLVCFNFWDYCSACKAQCSYFKFPSDLKVPHMQRLGCWRLKLWQSGSAIAAPHLQQNACALFFSSCKQLKTFATLKHKVQVMIFEPSVYTSKQIVQCQSRTDLPIPNNDFPLG